MGTLSTSVRATRDQVFTVLTDYKQYTDWTADVVEVNVLAQEGDIVVAEFYSPELMDVKYQLEFVHSRPTSIVYKQVDQYGTRGLRGSWHLAEAPDQRGTILTGEMRLKTSLVQSLANRRKVDLILQRRLDALQQMFSPLPAVGGKAPVVPQELERDTEWLKLLQDGEDVAVWFAGAKYLIKRVQ